MDQTGSTRPMGYSTAAAIVIASMIGTGVFTTLGLQAQEIQTGFALMILWALGGLVAVTGALSYGELAAAMPRSGGECHYLSQIYHPILGIVAGWISVTVGFAAPSGLAAMALSRYVVVFVDLPPVGLAVSTILLITLFHSFSVRIGQGFHVVMTAAKLFLILLFCVAGLLSEPVLDFSVAPSYASWLEVFSAPFFVSMIYVSYAYSGWNGATYVASEVRDPQRTIPRALSHGTLVVILCYLLLNLVFLRTIPAPQLAGTLEVGALSATSVNSSHFCGLECLDAGVCPPSATACRRSGIAHGGGGYLSTLGSQPTRG